MSDDLTIAYMLGIEDMRSKLHKQADEIERLRAENETLRRDVKTAIMGDSAELQDVKRENEKLRERLAEADEANRRVSDENQRIRQAIKEYLSNLASVTNDMLRETWEREVKDD